MSLLPFSFISAHKNPPTFSQSKLYYALISTLLVAVTSGAAGCSNNTPDASSNNGNNSVVSSSQTSSAQTNSGTSTPTISATADSDQGVVEALQTNLKASGIEETVISAVPTDMDGIYWVTVEGLPAFFTDKSGKHVIQGQIIAVGGNEPIDISGELIARTAKQALSAVDKADMVIYPAKGETKSVLYSFTDADCGYCRQLHSEMDEINALGIEVRYLAWPRSLESIPKMETIWCSEDRIAAMNQAKMGAEVSGPSCSSPVEEQMALGASLGVRGTPAIFTESGEQIGGYLPAPQLAQAAGIS